MPHVHRGYLSHRESLQLFAKALKGNDMSKKTKEKQELATEINLLKYKSIKLGMYRTGRMLDIASQEIGWELAGEETPKWQRERQIESVGSV